jgi:hypothetical protein
MHSYFNVLMYVLSVRVRDSLLTEPGFITGPPVRQTEISLPSGQSGYIIATLFCVAKLFCVLTKDKIARKISNKMLTDID